MTEDSSSASNQPAGQKAPAGPGTGETKGAAAKPRISEDTLNLFRIVICLALVVPVIQLYFTIPAAISMWVADQFVPFVNMVYFILVIIGGVWLIRYSYRFSDEERRRLREQ